MNVGNAASHFLWSCVGQTLVGELCIVRDDAHQFGKTALERSVRNHRVEKRHPERLHLGGIMLREMACAWVKH